VDRLDAPTSQALDDKSLLKHCEKHLAKLSFLSEKTRNLLQGEIKAAKADSEADSAKPFTDPGRVKCLWRELLIDAIHALKVRDKREKAQIQNFDVSDENKKTRARPQNVYGISALWEYFEALTEFERVLYGSQASYRDHVIHMLRVWLVGVYILTGFSSVEDLEIHLAPGKPQSKDAVSTACAVTPEERWAMWTVAALCHDLGYPLEKTHRINDEIDRMLSHFGNISSGRYTYSFQTQHRSLNEIMLRLVSSKVRQIKAPEGSTPDKLANSGKYQTAQQWKYYVKFAHSFEELKHGIISCLVLIKTLVYFMEADYDPNRDGRLTLEDARQFCIRNQILRAIASHTCPEVYHLQINTLSFLLILCDELQQWGRPTFEDMKFRGGGLDEPGDVSITQCDLKKGMFSATIKYKSTAANEKFIRDRFLLFHELMRPAIADTQRSIKKFEWRVESKAASEPSYLLCYESGKPPFEELSATKVSRGRRDDWLSELFKWEKS